MWKDEDIQIPRWYHATKPEYVNSIIKSKEIQVLHLKAYRGAWVSNEREVDYGQFVFAFDHRITDIDPNVSIMTEHQGDNATRWRGLQKPIHFDKNMILVGYDNTIYNKSKQKELKDNLKNAKVSDIPIVSFKQIDYIRETILKNIGHPNLSANWWGSADIECLDKVNS